MVCWGSTEWKYRTLCLCVLSTDGLWWFVVVWCGWPQSICVWVCAHLYLCTCVVLGANDSWHLAAISGSLISIERFGGEAQISLYLSNRCVFDLRTQFAHTRPHTHTPSIHSNSLTYGNVYKQVPLSMLILTARDPTPEKHHRKTWIIVKSVVSLSKKSHKDINDNNQ